jgi:flavin-dependent dehydrogenase
MMTQSIGKDLLASSGGEPSRLELTDGSRVAVLGGGPAGSFTSYFLLDLAERTGLNLEVDIYEPKDFTRQGPGGCNMCGGIISESLVQNLAAEGILLPPAVVQRGIDSYTLRMDVGTVRIETPLHEKRIGAVHRGGGPRGDEQNRWESFDGYLLSLAEQKGARRLTHRVEEVHFSDGHPELDGPEGSRRAYDLLVVAVGINGAAAKLLNTFQLGYKPPRTSKTYIREFFMSPEKSQSTLGNSMQVFLLDIPRLEFAAIIPKGDYVSMCLLGEDIDKKLIDSFLDSREVRGCMPADWVASEQACKCAPQISLRGALQPFADRVVFVGDAGVTRLYKDGIGAAYRTAKAAASAAIFEGVSAEDFRLHYWPACKRIEADNAIGRWIFSATALVQRMRFARRTIFRMVEKEQKKEGRQRRMSMVLWDMFTGSAPYRTILLRTVHPGFWLSMLKELGGAIFAREPRRQESGSPSPQS